MDLTGLKQFITERHRVYLRRREGLSGPWTIDPIIRDNRFCNVFRELDTVTIWVRKFIREPFAEHPLLWFMLAIARYINWPPTLRELLERRVWPDSTGEGWFGPSTITGVLEQLARDGRKVYTGAYMIRAESDPRTVWYNWTKHRYIAEVVIGKLWKHREKLTDALAPVKGEDSLQRAWGLLAKSSYFTGWGPFMAYEWVTDLRHTRYLRQANDIYTWANAGPGAARGLNRLHGRPIKQSVSGDKACQEMQEVMNDLNLEESRDFCEVFGQASPTLRFEMRDVEHMLCEFDKYERIRLGQGKMRSKYDWRSAKPLA